MNKLIVGLLVMLSVSAEAKLLGNPTIEQMAYFNKVADAIYVIENSEKYPYGIKSIPTNGNKELARKYCINTVRNNFYRWQAKGSKGDYLTFLANAYCPIGASDDPKGLNKNWLRNLRSQLDKQN
jgi:hypothetical protein